MFHEFLMIALLFTAPTRAQETPSFAGTWQRDPERSDDAEEKMRAAMQEMRERMAGRGGRMRPPGGGMPPRGDGPGGPPQVGVVPNSFTSELGRNEFRIDDGERFQIFYLDGEKHKRQMPNGVELETVSEMRGRTIHIEEKMRRGERQRHYELSPDGETMIVTFTVKMDGMKDAVTIRTVYERSDRGGA